METKVLWVVVEMDLCVVISQRPRLSPKLFGQLEAYVEFKVYFHNVFIHERRDPKKLWYKFPYLVTDTDIQEVVGKWPSEWWQPSDLGTRTNMVKEISFTQATTTKKKK